MNHVSLSQARWGPILEYSLTTATAQYEDDNYHDNPNIPTARPATIWTPFNSIRHTTSLLYLSSTLPYASIETSVP